MITRRPLLELGPDTWGTFGAGLFGAGLFGTGDTGSDGEVTPQCSSITVVRGLSPDGVLEQLEPGICTVRLTDRTLAPVTYEHSRPGRPLRVLCEEYDDVTGEVTRHSVFTGTIVRSVGSPTKDGRRYSVTITAFDAVSDLAKAPYVDAHAGSFAQRVTPILESTGLAYQVHDTLPDEAPGTLPSNSKTALEALTLARDTLHGFVYVDRDNVTQAYSNQARSYDPATLVLTDGSVAGMEYIDLDPSFDTDQFINILTVETVDGTPETFADDASVLEWGPHDQTVTVNDGSPEDHALIFRARLPDPDTTVSTVVLNGTVNDDFATVSQLDAYQPVRIVLEDEVDAECQILGVAHTITPRRNKTPLWMTTLTLRPRELLPLRWDDPVGIAWDDAPADLTWSTSINWHPV